MDASSPAASVPAASVPAPIDAAPIDAAPIDDCASPVSSDYGFIEFLAISGEKPKVKLSPRERFFKEIDTLPPLRDAWSPKACDEWVSNILTNYPDFNGGVVPPYIPTSWSDSWSSPVMDGGYKLRWVLLHKAFKPKPVSIIGMLPGVTYNGSKSVIAENGRPGVQVTVTFWGPMPSAVQAKSTEVSAKEAVPVVKYL
jgi:hypothetical protein